MSRDTDDPGGSAAGGGAADAGTLDGTTHDHGGLATAVAVRHLGADPAAATPRGGGDRFGLGRLGSGWTVEVLDPAPGRPWTLLELEPDLAPAHDPGPVPMVAVLADGRTFLLGETAGLAGFLESTARESDPAVLSSIVVRFASDRVEHVVTPAVVTAAGAAALRDAGAEPGPPAAAAEADGSWRLEFVTADLHRLARGGHGGVDFRAWTVTVHRAGAGVDWQVRPVALDIADGVDLDALLGPGLPSIG